MNIMGMATGSRVIPPPPVVQEPLDTDAICLAIERITHKVLDTASIDITVPVRVVKLLNARNGQYLVDHQGNNIEAFCREKTDQYKPDDHVMLHVPCGNWSGVKYIISHVNFEMGLSFADRFHMLNQWRARGPNWLSPGWYWRQRRASGTGAQGRTTSRNAGILAVNVDDHLSTDYGFLPNPASLEDAAWRHYFLDRSDINLPQEPELPDPPFARLPWTGTGIQEPLADIWNTVDTRMFQPFANSFDFIMVRANFQTRFSGVPTVGDYGLLIECYADNPYYDVQNSQKFSAELRHQAMLIDQMNQIWDLYFALRLGVVTIMPYPPPPPVPTDVTTFAELRTRLDQLNTLLVNQQIDYQFEILEQPADATPEVLRELFERQRVMFADAVDINKTICNLPPAPDGREDEPPYRLVTFRFSCKQFNGNPYNMTTPTPQQAVFEIPRGEEHGAIRGLLRVSLYQDAFETDVKQGIQYGFLDPETGDPQALPSILWDTSTAIMDPPEGLIGGPSVPAQFVLPNTMVPIRCDCEDCDCGDDCDCEGYAPLGVKNNIFVTDVDIRFAERLNLADNLFWIAIETPQGTTVYDEAFTGGNFPENPEVNLIARLFYGRDEITDPDTCQFHWFREKVSAVQELDCPAQEERDEFGRTWFDLGGNGWAPISRIMRRLGDTVPWEGSSAIDRFASWDGTSRNYVLGTQEYDTPLPFNQLCIPVEAVPWKWRYKVVCVYNPTPNTPEEANARATREVIVSEMEEISNPGSIYDFYLPEAAMSLDNNTTFLRVRDHKRPWTEPYYDSDGQFDTTLPPASVPAATALDVRDYGGPDWWVNWWADSLTRYQSIPVSPLERYPHIFVTPGGRIDTIIAGRFNINSFLNAKIITFMAEIFAPVTDANMPPDLNVQREIGIVRKTIVKEGGAPFLVEFSGPQSFNYNADGTIKMESANRDRFIRAHVRWAGGNYQEYCVEWIAPDKSTLLTRMGNAKVDSPEVGFNLHSSMMTNMFADANNVVRFQIRHYHDEQRTQNTVTLRIRLMTGEEFYFPRQIFFTKDGAQGTHGSEWSAPIWPTNAPRVYLAGTPVGPPRPDGGYDTIGGSDSNFAPYSRLTTCPRPLVLYGHSSNPGSLRDEAPGGATDLGNIPLVLRPFVTKNGVPLEELPEADNYSYEVFWDTRYTNQVWDDNAGCDAIRPMSPDYRARFGSFIGLGPPDAAFALPGTPNVFPPHIFATGAAMGVPLPGADDTPPQVHPHPMMAKTEFRGIIEEPVGSGSTYGAIRVRWQNTGRTGLGTDGNGANAATPGDMSWACVVKAQIDIYKHPTGGERTKVATIFSYWPVDLFLCNSNNIPIGYNPDDIIENWPRFVDYSPAGHSPQVFSSPLTFFYGENARNTLPPLPVTAEPENLNTSLATISKRPLKDEYGDIIPGTEKWFFEPNPHFLAIDGIYGAIRTNPPSEFGWGNARFVRPILFRLMIHANADINAWDGRSISTNEERGVILAPTMGAGWKHPYTNTFSGVIMGIDKSKRKTSYNGLFGGFSADEIKKNPYVTGLFGYQNGVSSFGIMENGMAYFGRADRGRMVFDGVNAQIYGGATARPNERIGGNSAPSMHGRMRLSFIDFYTDRNDATGEATFDRTVFDSASEVEYNSRVRSSADDSPAIDGPCGGRSIRAGQLTIPNGFRQFFVPDNQHSPHAGFSSGMLATPAIEIGQYTPPGRNYIRELKVCNTRDNPNFSQGTLEGLEIPGNRRFLVTYDGTMYAMNGFFKGNIVGSNIVGGQFFNGNGTFAVTRNGNLGIGRGTDWVIRRIKGPEGGSGDGSNLGSLWAPNMPGRTSGEESSLPPGGGPDQERISSVLPEGPMRNDFLGLGEGCEVTESTNGFNFYVASNGTVIANRMHLRGGSLNIGNFHIVGSPDNDLDAGDVVSYGTMYLIGGPPNATSPPPINSTGTNHNSLVAWGDAYFRGKLTNLGPTFFGGTPNKQAGQASGSGVNSNVANPMNSPLSIMPTYGTNVTHNNPVFPVRIGCWPLYFHNTEQALASETNGSWVCLSSPGGGAAGSNGYMPGFATRPSQYQGFLKPGGADLSESVVWRVDQCGMWSDGMFLTKRDWNGNKNDTTRFSPHEDGMGYIGWCEVERTNTVWTMMVKSLAGGAPSIAVEGYTNARISAGRQEVDARGAGSVAIDRCLAVVDTWSETLGGGGSRDSALVAISDGGQGSLIGTAKGEVCLISTARTSGTEFSLTYNIGDPTAILGIGSLSQSFSDVEDEFGEKVAELPSYNDGEIYGRGMTCSLDSMPKSAVSNAGTWFSCIRIGRTSDGAPPNPAILTHGGPGSVYLGAAEKIILQGVERSEYGSPGTDNCELRVHNFQPDNQFGICARFG